jgi:hypothetical protein
MTRSSIGPPRVGGHYRRPVHAASRARTNKGLVRSRRIAAPIDHPQIRVAKELRLSSTIKKWLPLNPKPSHSWLVLLSVALLRKGLRTLRAKTTRYCHRFRISEARLARAWSLRGERHVAALSVETGVIELSKNVGRAY